MMKPVLLLASLLLALAVPAHAEDSVPPQAPAQPDTQTQTSQDAPAATVPADAQTDKKGDFAKPTWLNLINTIVGLKALDIAHDDELLDEYAMLVHCDWYTESYNDEFKWRKIRILLSELIRKNTENFPTAYYYDSKLQLGAYDFDAQLFRFADKGGIENINAFLMSEESTNVCGTKGIHNIPHAFRAVLKLPVYVHGIPMTPTAGEKLLDTMKKEKNGNRIIYARFNLRIAFVPRFGKHMRTTRNTQQIVSLYSQGLSAGAGTANMDAELDSIQFFADPEREALIYTYKP